MHGPLGYFNRDNGAVSGDLEGADYAFTTGNSTIVAGAANLKGIKLHVASLSVVSNSAFGELFYDDDGLGTNKRVLLTAHIDAGGGNIAPSGNGNAITVLRVPPGKHLRTAISGGRCAVHFTLET